MDEKQPNNLFLFTDDQRFDTLLKVRQKPSCSIVRTIPGKQTILPTIPFSQSRSHNCGGNCGVGAQKWMIQKTHSGRFIGKAKLSKRRFEVDLSGHDWKMEGIRPGLGIQEKFPALPAEYQGGYFSWNQASVPGDVYTDLQRAGEIDDPYNGRNFHKAKWV